MTRWLLLVALLCGPASGVRADQVADINRMLQAGQTAEAIARLDRDLALKPKDPQLRFLKGIALADTQRNAEAIAVFTLLNEDYPELPEPYNNLAVLYAGQGQYDKARAALEAAVRGNPGYAAAYENLGDVFARLAAQAYERALVLEPMNPALPPKIAQLRLPPSTKKTDTRAASPPRPAPAASAP